LETKGYEQILFLVKEDSVMWDNRCTMHHVTTHDSGTRRVMHRTTVVGDGPVIAA